MVAFDIRIQLQDVIGGFAYDDDAFDDRAASSRRPEIVQSDPIFSSTNLPFLTTIKGVCVRAANSRAN